MAKEPFGSMSLGDHLEELRHRLKWALLGIAPILIVALFFGRSLLGLLIRPVRAAMKAEQLPDTLLATGVMETFNTYFYVALIMTIVVGLPWILYQLWMFVSPGLYEHEKRFVRFLLPLSVALTVLGVAFTYTIIMPYGLGFMVRFSAKVDQRQVDIAPLPEGVVPASVPVLDRDPPSPKAGDAWVNRTMHQYRVALPAHGGEGVEIYGMLMTRDAGVTPQFRISEYIHFILVLMLAFAAGFQLPVVILLLGWVGIIDNEFLKKYRRHSILGCAILAALITPGDPVSFFFASVPLYFLYEFGGFLLRHFPASRVSEGVFTKKKAVPGAEESAEGETARDVGEEEESRR